MPYTTLVLMLVVSVLVWHLHETLTMEKEQRRFEEYVDAKVRGVKERLVMYKMILEGGSGLFTVSQDVTRAEWRAYVQHRQIDKLYPGALGMGYCKIVYPEQVERHIAEIRSEGFHDYTIFPMDECEVYAPITFLEPLNTWNRGALGFDPFSETVRRRAMEHARDIGGPALSGRVSLVQNAAKDVQDGFIIYLPIFEKGMPKETIAQRRVALRGYVYGVFVMNEFMQGIFSEFSNLVDLEIYDGAKISLQTLFFDSHVSKANQKPIFTARRVLGLYGHQWTLNIDTRPEFEATVDRWTSKVLLGAGLVISLLVFFYLRLQMAAMAKTTQFSNELRASEERLRSLIDNMAAIVGELTPDGVFVDINQEALNISGLGWEDVIGKHLEEVGWFSYSSERLEQINADFENALRGELVRHDVDLRRADGTYVPIDFMLTPVIDTEGHVIKLIASGINISKRKEFEAALKDLNQNLEHQVQVRTAELAASEKRFRSLLQNLSGAVYRCKNDRDWTAMYVSEGVRDLLGIEPDDILAGQPTFGCLLHPEDVQRLWESVQYALAARTAWQAEFRMRHADGRWCWIMGTGRGEWNEQGELLYLDGFLTDISDRKRAEETIRESEEMLRNIAENIDEVFWLQSEDDGRMLYVSPAYEAIWGRSCLSLLQHPESFIDSIFDEDRAHVNEAYSKYKHSGQFSEEYRIFRPDGSIRWIQARTFPVKDKYGNTVRHGGVAQDITGRKQFEQQLHESRQLYQSVVDTQAEMICRYLPDTTLTFVNDAYCRAFGKSRRELLGHKYLMFLPPEMHAREVESIKSLSLEQPTTTREYQILLPDGSICWQLWTDHAVFVEGGEIREIQGIGRDITERKQAEQERLARQAAEAASRQKSLFLSHMSHEIRTPLNAILGFGQILEREHSLPLKQKQQIRLINRAGRHLLELINAILDMGKIEAGRSELKVETFSLRELLDDLEMMFLSRAEAKNLRFEMERASNLPLYVLGDKSKLLQVLVNLLGNAVKFTLRGWVKARVRTAAHEPKSEMEAETVRLIVEVEDSGPGISQEDMKILFKPFEQGEAGVSNGGTGLGLAISHKLVELMGGSLRVESKVGQGSCFQLDVQLEMSHPPVLEENPNPRLVVGLDLGLNHRRILVVDDVESNRNLLRDLLEPLGFEIREAINGAQAIEIFQEWTPHAVLMDMRMPVMNGYEATRRIKATEAGRDTPVIAITASVFTESEEEILATGVSANLRKPFRIEDLYRILGRHLGLSYLYANEAARTPGYPNLPEITMDSLNVLPRDLVLAMRDAALGGDMERLEELIQQIYFVDGAVAQKLQVIADRYDYEFFDKLCEQRGIEHDKSN